MFTGLIEEIGIVKDCKYSPGGCVLTVSCKKISADISLGASIAINGACLTVTKILTGGFQAEISIETLSKIKSNIAKIGTEVNLERALKISERLDGHIVTGHIDCGARLKKVVSEGFSKRFYFKIEDEFKKYLVYKGSIAINGVSLTIAEKNSDTFAVVVIPTTIENTNLKNLKPDDTVNIETDILSKYVENFLNINAENSVVDKNFLLENGFI